MKLLVDVPGQADRPHALDVAACTTVADPVEHVQNSARVRRVRDCRVLLLRPNVRAGEEQTNRKQRQNCHLPGNHREHLPL